MSTGPRPIPVNALLHFVALFPETPASLDPLRAALLHRLPEASFDLSAFQERKEPRQIAWGEIPAGGARLHLLLDREGLPGAIGEAVTRAPLSPAAAAAVQAHDAALIGFLVAAAPDAGPLDRARTLAALAFACLDAGAHLLAFPDGRTAFVPDELRALDPAKLTADELWLFVSRGWASPPDELGRAWVRTFGLHGFGLPDVATRIYAQGLGAGDEAKAADALLGNLPRYLLELGRPLQPGETVNVAQRRWKVAEPPAELPFRAGPTGVVVLQRDDA